MSATERAEIDAECQRQRENCEYTAVALHLWLAELRKRKAIFAVIPVAGGAVAAVAAASVDHPSLRVVGVLASALIGSAPAVYSALKGDATIQQCERLAPRFLNLRDRFRQAPALLAEHPIQEYRREFEHLMARMEELRAEAMTVPEKYFLAARRKIGAGHYSHTADSSLKAP